MSNGEVESEVPQSQGKYPPKKQKPKTAEGAGYPEPGTMRPTTPPAPDGMAGDDRASTQQNGDESDD